jgi:hypothetical protein
MKMNNENRFRTACLLMNKQLDFVKFIFYVLGEN